MNKPAQKGSTLHGRFSLPGHEKIIGQLHLKGPSSTLKFHSDENLAGAGGLNYIPGVSAEGMKLSCIDCVMTSAGYTSRVHYLELFPHYIVVGDEHLDPASKTVRSIRFTTSDLFSLFYDFDTFGTVINAAPIMGAVLEANRRIRPIDVGEWPEVYYFTGKVTVIEVDTIIGRVTVRHQPTSSMGGPAGISVRNKIVVSIESPEPIVFQEAISHLAILRRFLSMAAGRPQRPENIELTTVAASEAATHRPLTIHWSYPPKGPRGDYHRPHPADLPLDPINHPSEFKNVLRNWIAKDNEMKASRGRFISCIEKRSYNVDRLVAAANMFDLLPFDEVPVRRELPEDVAIVCANALKALESAKDGLDKESAVGAIKRLGNPSLPKKAKFRWGATNEAVEAVFPDLGYVLTQAIKCRNHFVHGPSDSFKFDRAEKFVPFLTDALEFVFAISDLVSCGWSPQRWANQPYGNGHTFTRFRCGYKETVAAFKASMTNGINA